MTDKTSAARLRKVLGVAFGIAVVVGGAIGVGILRTPSSIAGFLPFPTLILVCWLAAGLYVLMAASCYAELTTMLLKAGGAYNYIQRAFGRYAGFLSGWFDFIINAIAPAYFCIALSEFAALLIPQLKPYPTGSAIAFLTLFALINLPSVKSGSVTQQITSAAKVLLFLLLIGGCFLSGKPNNLQSIPPKVVEGGMMLGIFKSLQLIMGSYSGWNAVSFFAEEDNNPGRNIPKSYLVGVLTITLVYVLINAAILYVLPVHQIAASPLAAAPAAAVAFGPWSTQLITIVAVFSLLSILNAYMMIPSRILFGLSREGFFIKQGSLVNKGGTPYFSLLFCYALALLLIF
jgi:basic amino acid/polyamine antiporter, APA family